MTSLKGPSLCNEHVLKEMTYLYYKILTNKFIIIFQVFYNVQMLIS